MNIKDVSRDEIKSQLIEGLKHSRKILKNKKGKTNRDLVFTVMDKQFLITRKHGNNYVFFITDDKTRNEYIEIYLDNEIKSDRHGSKELRLFMVGDMSRYNLDIKGGIRMPTCNLRDGFRMKCLDVLINDEMSENQKRYWEHAVKNNFIRERQVFDDGGYRWKSYNKLVRTEKVNYKEQAIKDATHHIDTLVEQLLPYFDDNYLSVCEKTNEVFVEMFKAEGLASINDSEYLNDEGKKVFSQKFIDSLTWDVERVEEPYYSSRNENNGLIDLSLEEDKVIEGRLFDTFRLETSLFSKNFRYGILQDLEALTSEHHKDVLKRAWELAYEDVESLKEVA